LLILVVSRLEQAKRRAVFETPFYFF